MAASTIAAVSMNVRMEMAMAVDVGNQRGRHARPAGRADAACVIHAAGDEHSKGSAARSMQQAPPASPSPKVMMPPILRGTGCHRYAMRAGWPQRLQPWTGGFMHCEPSQPIDPAQGLRR
jgi:hypothetical protein